MKDWLFLLSAAGNTLALSVISLIFGLLLALLFLALESARFKPLSWLGTTLVTIIRGLPELLVILFVCNGVPWLILQFSDGIELFGTTLSADLSFLDASAFIYGVIALSLLYGAYASQALRGGLKAVAKGQWEAGLALGLTKWHIFKRLILPQMWRHALPGLGNQWLILLKDTALVSLISVNEIMMQAKSIITRTHQPFTWYLHAALLYLVISLLSQYLIKILEQRFTRFERQPG